MARRTGMPQARQDDQSLSDTLDECNSVIRAPEVGDSELTTPPPKTGGSMPVLKPGDIPRQQSSEE